MLYCDHPQEIAVVILFLADMYYNTCALNSTCTNIQTNNYKYIYKNMYTFCFIYNMIQKNYKQHALIMLHI